MIRKSILILTAFVVALVARAADPVSWTVSLDSIGHNLYRLTATGEISPDYHIYGYDMSGIEAGAGVPDATTMTLTLPDGVEAVGEMETGGNVAIHVDEVLELELPWVTGTAVMSQQLKVPAGTTGLISGGVSYMACTEQACTPPATFRFSVPLPGTAESVTSAPVATVAPSAPAAVAMEESNHLAVGRQAVRHSKRGVD